MAIVAYVGLPRAGKSYSAIENAVLVALTRHRQVWTNIPLHMDVVQAEYPDAQVRYFTAADVSADADFFSSIPGGAVVVIDEPWRFWPSGLKANQMQEREKSFFAEHGHRVGENGLTLEIVLVTQDLAQLCAFIRQLVDKTFRVQKLDGIGFKSKFVTNVYQGCVTGDRPPKDRHIQRVISSYRPEVWRFYQSHTQGAVDGLVGVEEGTDGRASKFCSARWRVGAPLALVLAALGLVVLWRVTHPSAAPAPAPAARSVPEPVPAQQLAVVPASTLPVSASVASQPVPAPAPVSGPAERLPESARWRVAGSITRPDGVEVIVLTDGVYTRTRVLWTGSGCQRTQFDELECQLPGELVTQYSGSLPGAATTPVPAAPGPLAPGDVLAKTGAAVVKAGAALAKADVPVMH